MSSSSTLDQKGCFAVVVLSQKIKLGISCELSDSHEMASFIFSHTIRILYATLMLGAIS